MASACIGCRRPRAGIAVPTGAAPWPTPFLYAGIRGRSVVCDKLMPQSRRVLVSDQWTGALGTETKGLLRPLAFCRDHSQSLRDGLPEGAIWLDKPPESE